MNKCLYFLLAVLALSAGCRKINFDQKDLRDFTQVNLVSNTAKYNPANPLDPTLMNAWGLAFSSGGTPWVNSLPGHVSEVYTADGALVPARPAVRIPSPTDTMGGLPTGVVFAGGKGFRLSNGVAASFLFVGVDGVLSGWNGGNNAIRIKDLSATSSFTGLAIASWGSNNYIYAADFRSGKIFVWDTGFARISMPFNDPTIPHGFHPFNIQAVGNWLFVTYAKVGPDGKDQAGAGNGFVDIYGTDGSFVRRLASRGGLNSPWGVTAAGPTFLGDNGVADDDDHGDNHGKNSGKGSDNSGPGSNHGNDDHHNDDSVILVGNFGDGRINAYGMNGQFLGQLQSHNRTIVIDGLWALSFAPTTSTVDQSRLYFTAGPDDESNGIFGYLKKQ